MEEQELPKGWINVFFNEIADATDFVANGSFESIKNSVKFSDTERYAVMVRLKDYTSNWKEDFKYLTKDSYDFLSKSSLVAGDLFMTNVGAPGKLFLIPELGIPMTIGPNGLRIRAKKITSNKFLAYYYQSGAGKKQINNIVSGTAQQKFNKTGLRFSTVLVPPLAEQNRIVEKLDKLFASLEIVKTKLDAIPQLLKSFKQAVLSQAVAGKLTNKWRLGKNLDKWEHLELNKVLPKGGIFDGPFGSNLKTADYTLDGVRVIRLENIEHLCFLEDKETYVSEKKYQNLIRHTVRPGDIIFSSFISENIRACILPEMKTQAIAKADCFCIRPIETSINKEYLLFVLVSRRTYLQLVSKIHGATRPRVNTSQLKAIDIPLPSLPEQEEIVRKVGSLFEKADIIESAYNLVKSNINNLPNSILTKAFSGDLVPQNLDDEPAIELLLRIKELQNLSIKVTRLTRVVH